MSTLSVVTIGQAPRVDVTPELAGILGDGVRIVEHGALDGLTADQIAALAPAPGASGVLTSRLADGSYAVFTHDGVNPLLGRAIARGEAGGADATLLICSSHFPEFPHDKPVFALERLAHAGVHGLLSGFDAPRLGLVNPLADQVDDGIARWRDSIGAVIGGTAAASPYADSIDDIAAAAASIAPSSDLIVLDCIGYGRDAERAARAACADAGHPVPVVTVRAVGARLLAAML